ncbi:hypothetical protein FHS01_003027 [Longimicrobium terrae]|uniref:Uncharacterized protein n=1 Tax=Longimicrobium terrae TaxID=1639882 RepID=A0A841H088_9BACT|nr:hypothetical protein [Longimicrobium terrae]MBB6071386.1 hypothetical protein [Longimicrobium terrae]
MRGDRAGHNDSLMRIEAPIPGPSPKKPWGKGDLSARAEVGARRRLTSGG